jgi:uncharacterized protein (DUF58 family)
VRDWLKSLARVNVAGPDGEISVSGRAVYVLPTKYGLLYLVLVLALLIGAINYANNPAFLLSFVLTGVGLAVMVQTWRNLQGLRLSLAAAEPGFVGGEVGYRFRLVNERASDRPALYVTLAGGTSEVVDLVAAGHQVVMLSRSAKRRGRCLAGRLIVSTRYPLGLLRAWCYVEADAWAPAWPRPAELASPPLAADSEGHGEGGGQRQGTEDFVGLREYRPGDSPRQLHWKALAAGRGLLTKQFGAGGHETLWLDWSDWSYLDTEARLSRLCREVLDAHQRGQPFGLILPGQRIEPALGEAHKRACLTALALYGEAS